jgi:hypothetical protein
MSITLDDFFPDHPKVLTLTDAAFRLLVKSWCYAKRHRTGGVLRHGVLETLYPKRAKYVIRELVEHRLLEVTSEGGYSIHDWADWWNEDQDQAESYKSELTQRRRALSYKRSTAGKARAAGAVRDGEGKFVQQPTQHNTQHPPSTIPSTPPACAGPAASTESQHVLVFAGSNGASKPSIQPAPSRARVGGRTDARRSDPDPRSDLTETMLLKDLDLPSTHTRDPVQQPRQPMNLEEALEIPIGQRARVCTTDPHLAAYLQPEEWPEVRAIATQLGEALGQRVVLGAYYRDSGVRAVVECFAAGFTEQELTECARANEAWWRKERRGLSSLTPEVVRRSLAKTPPGFVEHTDVRPKSRRELALLEEADRLVAEQKAKGVNHG